jgi:hypothetical protein
MLKPFTLLALGSGLRKTTFITEVLKVKTFGDYSAKPVPILTK